MVFEENNGQEAIFPTYSGFFLFEFRYNNKQLIYYTRTASFYHFFFQDFAIGVHNFVY